MEKNKDLNKILKNFSDWLEDFDIAFESSEELIAEHDDERTYTVRISGLNYTDAQDVIEMGLEYGKNATIVEEI